ncbi:MAG: type II toxin-antitoxin system Phd/YefM family antitoxin [Burkholderiales bacterium]|nr:type II toxin-antitoxin system Phd/YefM family antitoxin [Burkholderiales bacterium]
MKAWPVQDAKARFSELLEACITDGPQLVTRRGVETAVLVPVAEWRRLSATARPSLKQLLLSDAGRTESLTPPRAVARRRRNGHSG